MPRTGSSIAWVTSARSLSSAQLSARSRLLIFLTIQMLIGSASDREDADDRVEDDRRAAPIATSSGADADQGGEDPEQLLHQLEVGDRAGDELAGRDLVEVPQLGRLDVGVEPHPEVELDLVPEPLAQLLR